MAAAGDAQKKTIDFVIFCCDADRECGEALEKFLNETLKFRSCLFDDDLILEEREQYALHVPDRLCKLSVYKLILVSDKIGNSNPEIIFHKCAIIAESIRRRDESVIPVFMKNKETLYKAFQDSSTSSGYGLMVYSGIHVIATGSTAQQEVASFKENLQVKARQFTKMGELANEKRAASVQQKPETVGTAKGDLETDSSLQSLDSLSVPSSTQDKEAEQQPMNQSQLQPTPLSRPVRDKIKPEAAGNQSEKQPVMLTKPVGDQSKPVPDKSKPIQGQSEQSHIQSKQLHIQSKPVQGQSKPEQDQSKPEQDQSVPETSLHDISTDQSTNEPAVRRTLSFQESNSGVTSFQDRYNNSTVKYRVRPLTQQSGGDLEYDGAPPTPATANSDGQQGSPFLAGKRQSVEEKKGSILGSLWYPVKALLDLTTRTDVLLDTYIPLAEISVDSAYSHSIQSEPSLTRPDASLHRENSYTEHKGIIDVMEHSVCRVLLGENQFGTGILLGTYNESGYIMTTQSVVGNAPNEAQDIKNGRVIFDHISNAAGTSIEVKVDSAVVSDANRDYVILKVVFPTGALDGRFGLSRCCTTAVPQTGTKLTLIGFPDSTSHSEIKSYNVIALHTSEFINDPRWKSGFGLNSEFINDDNRIIYQFSSPKGLTGSPCIDFQSGGLISMHMAGIWLTPEDSNVSPSDLGSGVLIHNVVMDIHSKITTKDSKCLLTEQEFDHLFKFK